MYATAETLQFPQCGIINKFKFKIQIQMSAIWVFHKNGGDVLSLNQYNESHLFCLTFEPFQYFIMPPIITLILQYN